MRAREGEERGKGVPLTDEERRLRHEELYPGEPLPPRGYGLTRVGRVGQIDTSTGLLFLVGSLLGLGALVYIATRK